jgi:hypothetical protein
MVECVSLHKPSTVHLLHDHRYSTIYRVHATGVHSTYVTVLNRVHSFAIQRLHQQGTGLFIGDLCTASHWISVHRCDTRSAPLSGVSTLLLHACMVVSKLEKVYFKP